MGVVHHANYVKYLELARIDVVCIRDLGQFVRERDVDVTEGVFGQLGHLRGLGIREMAAPACDARIEPGGNVGAARAEAADDPVVAAQFGQDAPGQDPLRAMGDVDRRACAFLLPGNGQVRTGPCKPAGELARRPHGHG